MNALNAIFAIMKWKKLSGYYQDLVNENTIYYTTNDSNLINENKDI